MTITPRAILRSTALFLLPASLLAASTYLAAGLTLALLLCTNQRRRVTFALSVIGVLAAGALATVTAVTSDILDARSAPLISGPFGTLALWLLAAVALAIVYANLSSNDAPLLSLGSAAAAIAGGLFAIYQVNGLEELRANLLTFHPNLAAAGFIATLGGVLVGFSRLWRRGPWARLVLLAGLGAGLLGLLLTGSRGGQLGAMAGVMTIVVIAATRVRWRTLLMTALSLAALGTGLYLLDRAMRGPPTPNFLVNSGFEDRLLPWAVDGTTTRIPTDQVSTDNEFAVKLQRANTTSVRLLRYSIRKPIPRDARGAPLPLTVSFDVLPANAAEAQLPIILLFEANDAEGNLVSRLGVDGWTAEAGASLDTVGGRPRLPAGQANEWQRFSVAVPPAPPGATTFRIELQATGSDVGAYGLIDNLMLAPATAGTAYIPGPNPGLFTFLSPATTRLQQLSQPLTAAGGRVPMWFLGLDLAAARPVLGYGPGSERQIVEEYAAKRVRRPLLHFHSFYLRLLLEGGSVLLATVLVMVGYLLTRGFRGIRQRAPGSVALVATTIALLVQSVFDPVLAFGEVVAGLWLIIAVVGDPSESKRDDDPVHPRLMPNAEPPPVR